MSVQLAITAFLEDSQVKQQQIELERKNVKISQGIEANEKAAKQAFNKAMGYMRASYMIFSGVGQIIGGTMGRMFSGIYSVAISSIMTLKAIAAAMLATPGGQAQAVIMFANLIVALANLKSVMTGRTELSRRLSGFNTALHGIGGMIDSFSM